jgi:hypothetical protein
VFENENFERVSFKWDQLILFSKMIVKHLLNTLLADLHSTKGPRMLGM